MILRGLSDFTKFYLAGRGKHPVIIIKEAFIAPVQDNLLMRGHRPSLIGQQANKENVAEWLMDTRGIATGVADNNSGWRYVLYCYSTGGEASSYLSALMSQ